MAGQARQNKSAAQGAADRSFDRLVRSVAVMPSVVAMTIAAAIGNAEHALDASDHTANACADSAANHTAHRPGRTIATASALLGSADDALRVRKVRNREQCESRQRGNRMQPEQRWFGDGNRIGLPPSVPLHSKFSSSSECHVNAAGNQKLRRDLTKA